MNTRKKTARLAGLYYLFNVVLSVLYMEYIPSLIPVWNNPESTLENLINHETLFRVGILLGIAVHISFILLPITLHKLLGHINKHFALMMVVFALISVPISFTLLIDQYELLGIFKDYGTMDLIGQREAGLEVLTFYETLYDGFLLCQTYWGLWLFPFGYLVFKSGFLPKFLGIALMLGCITYMIDIIGSTLFANYHEHVDTMTLIIPAAIGEIGICLWLLIIGTKDNIKF
ncbi:DUF4386 family protein [Muricauda sp. JGD-17]|uniref:DUF4386 family protein n=1 Tax=Flagellimonas ochracea TaxID=2696472 RepID=A0A964WZ58_9FLAO|nr:DUF4386 domain-containing protein [Allomuricauda ochracea]NAY93474.1 DUF4386 family protein [Allomuricauda ochracea]